MFNTPLAAARYQVNGADFDGTNDFATRGADWTGSADSKQGIFSSWIRLDGGDATDMRLLEAQLVFFSIQRTTGNKFLILGRNTGSVDILNISTTSSYTSGATWRHFLASWDLAAGTKHLYMNDVSDLTVTTFTNDTIDYTRTNHGLGSTIGGTIKFNGCLAETYFAQGQFLDFSVTANRRKFITAAGKPANLGANGSRPTGVSPTAYFRLTKTDAANSFATNRGGGGGMTLTGSLDIASTSP